MHQDPRVIAAAGEAIFIALFGGGRKKQQKSCEYKEPSLDDIRNNQFMTCATNRSFNLALLPPTSVVAAQHSFRTYHQTQNWLDVDKGVEDWGWIPSERGWVPVYAGNFESVPAELLK